MDQQPCRGGLGLTLLERPHARAVQWPESVVLSRSLPDRGRLHSGPVPPEHLQHPHRPISGQYLIRFVSHTQSLSYHSGTAHASASRLLFREGHLLGKADQLVSRAGPIPANHYLRSGPILEGGGYADGQVRQVGRSEVHRDAEENVI